MLNDECKEEMVERFSQHHDDAEKRTIFLGTSKSKGPMPYYWNAEDIDHSLESVM